LKTNEEGRLDVVETGGSAGASKKLKCHPPQNEYTSQARPLGKEGNGGTLVGYADKQP
jgi:hypothetical protein